jgi:hypothetical protein
VNVPGGVREGHAVGEQVVGDGWGDVVGQQQGANQTEHTLAPGCFERLSTAAASFP